MKQDLSPHGFPVNDSKASTYFCQQCQEGKLKPIILTHNKTIKQQIKEQELEEDFINYCFQFLINDSNARVPSNPTKTSPTKPD
jgi:hypothetical protein